MELPYITFLTTERAEQFWQMVRALFLLGAPFLVIWVATVYAGDLISVIRVVFSKAFGRKNDDYDYRDDDE